jgi:hypothetical protein
MFTNYNVVEDKYKEVYQKVIELLPKEKETGHYAEPVGLAEALKIRVITKGPRVLYYALKPVQRWLHTTLRKTKVFQLIGKPVTSEILNKVFKPQKNLQMAEKSQTFLSVDYSAATDKIDPYYSEVAMREIAKKLGIAGTDLEELLVDALVRHKMVNPADKEQSKEQKWGQLMGSIVSFPILCIVNCAVMSICLERGFKRKISFKDLPLLINGDDAVARTNSIGVETWRGVAPLAGLYPSIGKVLDSARKLNINSTLFQVKPNGELEQVKYINMGLILGLKRSEANVSVRDAFSGMDSIGARHRELKRMTPDDLWSVTNDLFLTSHKEVLDKLHVPWYIPENLGGVGLFYDGKSYNGPHQPTEFDLKASRVLANPERYFDETQAKKIKVRKVPTDLKRMKTDEVTREFLKKIPMQRKLSWEVTALDKELIDNYDEFEGMMNTWAIYFRPNDVIGERKSNPLKILRDNEKVWKKLFENQWRFKDLKPYNRKSEIDLDGVEFENDYRPMEFVDVPSIKIVLPSKNE